MAALDNRLNNSTKSSGLLQATDYLAGLSGGAWLVGSLVISDWITPETLLQAMTKMSFPESSLDTWGMLMKIVLDTASKNSAGFQTSVTDSWGRLFHYLTGQAGLNYTDPTWSSIQNLSSFTSHEMPFPIILSTTLFPGTSFDVSQITHGNSQLEMTPYEVGSWDSTFRHFANTEYLGTPLDAGKPVDQCVKGYDNAHFLMCTSGSIFNADFIGAFNIKGWDKVFVETAMKYLEIVNQGEFQVGMFENPFYKMSDMKTNQTISRGLYLYDGGFDQSQNIPFIPLIQPEREIDLIIATDPSTDTLGETGWPNGQSVRSAQAKSDLELGDRVFPRIPDADTFLNQNLSHQPVFFGCNTTGLTPYTNTTQYSPVILYMPMTTLTYVSNFSTGKFFYGAEDLYRTYTNAWNMMTRSNGTDDSNWDKCLGCATLLREFQRRDSDIPSDCQSCYEAYCYN